MTNTQTAEAKVQAWIDEAKSLNLTVSHDGNTVQVELLDVTRRSMTILWITQTAGRIGVTRYNRFSKSTAPLPQKQVRYWLTRIAEGI